MRCDMHRFALPVFGVFAVVIFSGCVSQTPYRSGSDGPFGQVDPVPTQIRPVGDARWDSVLDVGGADLVVYDSTAPAAMREVSIKPAGPTRHTVAPGETLYAIARQHLGDGSRWRDLIDANPGLSPDALAVGQVIRVP